MNPHRRENRNKRDAFRKAWKRTAPSLSLKAWARSIADQPMTPWAVYAALWLDRKARSHR
jgi:hypothetical protein